ncbi:hypothetical protein [Methanobacterium petrolearium]|uniref:hypothetical protein n=1 Tax=Methanobacterium petrolearium TaxID=710190 RepID=UPI001FD8378C|nr:hypothetical protein [Methanobacterium petrolearium]MBP1945140.1 putative amidophosphoribosyltransferase [Methanobacterium petrolearium]
MDGESPNDYESCECGGKLHILEYDEENQLQSPRILCESCGNPNDIHTPFCSRCGQILKPAREIVVKNEESLLKPKVFAGLTFVVVSIMVLGLLL